ncbi:MAG: hypothetical protein GC171_02465 [Terrimonas sp.]|nr:hypothetical protein [Terrimonas sp.]
MKIFNLLIGLVTTTALFISCNAQTSGATQVNSDAFEKELHAKNVQLLDVRTSGEYNNGHIANTLLADWTNSTQFQDRIKYMDKNIPVLIYCASGARSAAAASWMRKNGFKQVTELEGGFIQWKRDHKPVETSAPQQQMTLDDYQHMIPGTGTVLVDFGADWCPPCVKMQPVLDDLEKSLQGKFTLIRVDVGTHTNILQPLNVEAYPTFIIYKNGKEIWRQSGIVEKSVLQSQLL